MQPAIEIPDPLKFAKKFWPNVVFYEEQKEIIYSVINNDETFVPAGNKLGKDFVGGFLIVYFFMTRHPCRIVTTSAKEDHLRVLWGEMKQFIFSSESPLDSKSGGPLVINHHELKKIVDGKVDPLSYVKGMVANPESIAAMGGHHIAQTGDGIPRTMFMTDESSSVPTSYYDVANPWANRIFAIGNTWHCENFFKHAILGTPDGKDPGGDLLSDDGKRYYRKVIQIKAEHSPNVRFALAQIEKGIEPTDEMIIPGVKPYSEYVKHRKLWDAQKQSISLDATFYEGKENKLYPKEWLDRAAQLAVPLEGSKRTAKAMGVDPAEGGDSSVWSVIDDLGLIYQISMKTPDTTDVTDETIRLIKLYNLNPKDVYFDRGGGGKEHADRLRVQGYPVKSVGFGESPNNEIKRGLATIQARKEQQEEKYVYKNLRSQMYHILSMLLDPSMATGFSLPSKYHELRRQLSPVPKLYDGEGRLMLPPKNKPTMSATGRESSIITMQDLLGCSPDESDSLVLATYSLARKSTRSTIKVL